MESFQPLIHEILKVQAYPAPGSPDCQDGSSPRNVKFLAPPLADLPTLSLKATLPPIKREADKICGKTCGVAAAARRRMGPIDAMNTTNDPASETFQCASAMPMSRPMSSQRPGWLAMPFVPLREVSREQGRPKHGHGLKLAAPAVPSNGMGDGRQTKGLRERRATKIQKPRQRGPPTIAGHLEHSASRLQDVRAASIALWKIISDADKHPSHGCGFSVEG